MRTYLDCHVYDAKPLYLSILDGASRPVRRLLEGREVYHMDNCSGYPMSTRMKVTLVSFAAISYYFIPTLTLGLLCVSIGSLALKVALHILTQQDKKIAKARQKTWDAIDGFTLEMVKKNYSQALQHVLDRPSIAGRSEIDLENCLRELVYAENFEFNRDWERIADGLDLLPSRNALPLVVMTCFIGLKPLHALTYEKLLAFIDRATSPSAFTSVVDTLLKDVLNVRDEDSLDAAIRLDLAERLITTWEEREGRGDAFKKELAKFRGTARYDGLTLKYQVNNRDFFRRENVKKRRGDIQSLRELYPVQKAADNFVKSPEGELQSRWNKYLEALKGVDRRLLTGKEEKHIQNMLALFKILENPSPEQDFAAKIDAMITSLNALKVPPNLDPLESAIRSTRNLMIFVFTESVRQHVMELYGKILREHGIEV